MESELYVPCPYDESHQILKNKLHVHVQKCQRNHPNSTKVCCEYNTTHIIDRMELDHHMASCPSSGYIRSDEFVTSYDLMNPIAANTILNHVPKNTTGDENWDNEDGHSYNPLNNIQNRMVYLMQSGMSKAQKKLYRKAERERHRNLQNSISTGYTPLTEDNLMQMDSDKPLRPPRQAAKVCSIQDAASILKTRAQHTYRKKQSISDQLSDTTFENREISLNSSQQTTKTCLDQVACNNQRGQDQSICNEEQSIISIKNNTSICIANNSSISEQLDQSMHNSEACNKTDIKQFDDHNQELNKRLESIEQMFKNDLSFISTYCDDYIKGNREYNGNMSTDSSDSKSSNAIDNIDSRIALLEVLEQSISEEKETLKKRKESILQTAESQPERLSKLMGMYSTGRGFTRLHRKHLESIERKPGAGLQLSPQQNDTILQNQHHHDTDRFSDDIPNEKASKN